MKTLVDCDFVFNVLTRGPYPPIDANQGEEVSPQAIELHLAACYECRQLAEALRPSVALFHETLSEEERETLPSFNDTEMMARLHSKIIEAVFESEEDPEKIRRIDRACRRWLAPAMVLVPIVAVILIMAIGSRMDSFLGQSTPMISFSPFSSTPATVGVKRQVPGACLVPIVYSDADEQVAVCSGCHHENENRFADRGSGRCNSCHRDSMARINLPTDGDHFHCCVSCHRSGLSQRMAAESISTLVKTCQVCHDVE